MLKWIFFITEFYCWSKSHWYLTVLEAGPRERPSSRVGYLNWGAGGDPRPDRCYCLAFSRRIPCWRQAGLQDLGRFPCLGRMNSGHGAAASGWDAHVAGSSPLWDAVPGFLGELCCPEMPMTKSSPVSRWGAGSRKDNWPSWDQCGSQYWSWALQGFALSLRFCSLIRAVPGLDLPSPTTGIYRASHCKCVPRHRDALPWSWSVAG